MKMDKRFPPAKLTFRSDGKDRLFKRINKKNEIRVDRNTNTGDVRRKKGEKLSRAFFFFSRANELTVHSMYSVDRNLVISVAWQ